MTSARWWLVGALILGMAVIVYVVLFCPTDCH